MEWNLLLGGEHPNDERLGYTWLEFGRLDDGGARLLHDRLRDEGREGSRNRRPLVLRHRPARRRGLDARRRHRRRAYGRPAGGNDRLARRAAPAGARPPSRGRRAVVRARRLALRRADRLADQDPRAAAVQAPGRARPLRRADRRAASARPGADRRRRRGVPRAGGGRRAARRDDRRARRLAAVPDDVPCVRAHGDPSPGRPGAAGADGVRPCQPRARPTPTSSSPARRPSWRRHTGRWGSCAPSRPA